jgi:3-dehydroquinate synthase
MDDIQQQSIQVTFRYPVVFTTDLFSAENPTLEEILGQRPAAHPPARLLFVIDRGVVEAQPDLLSAIERHCLRHAGRLEPAGPPLVIEGGEEAKNNPLVLEQVLAAIHSARLCRHSYVAAIGGGAVLDVVG